MIFESIRTIESLATLITSISSFAAMNQSMLVVNRASQKALSTQSAMIWALSSVTLADVIIQVRTDRKATITAFNVACKWLDATMETQVLPQVAGLGVRFSADLEL
jgi:hypothetical protein